MPDVLRLKPERRYSVRHNVRREREVSPRSCSKAHNAAYAVEHLLRVPARHRHVVHSLRGFGRCEFRLRAKLARFVLKRFKLVCRSARHRAHLRHSSLERRAYIIAIRRRALKPLGELAHSLLHRRGAERRLKHVAECCRRLRVVVELRALLLQGAVCMVYLPAQVLLRGAQRAELLGRLRYLRAKLRHARRLLGARGVVVLGGLFKRRKLLFVLAQRSHHIPHGGLQILLRRFLRPERRGRLRNFIPQRLHLLHLLRGGGAAVFGGFVKFGKLLFVFLGLRGSFAYLPLIFLDSGIRLGKLQGSLHYFFAQRLHLLLLLGCRGAAVLSRLFERCKLLFVLLYLDVRVLHALLGAFHRGVQLVELLPQLAYALREPRRVRGKIRLQCGIRHAFNSFRAALCSSLSAY